MHSGRMFQGVTLDERFNNNCCLVRGTCARHLSNHSSRIYLVALIFNFLIWKMRKITLSLPGVVKD